MSASEYRILLVFPNRLELKSIQKMLLEKGFKNILTANNGLKAWDTLNRNKCDLVISERRYQSSAWPSLRPLAW